MVGTDYTTPLTRVAAPRARARSKIWSSDICISCSRAAFILRLKPFCLPPASMVTASLHAEPPPPSEPALAQCKAALGVAVPSALNTVAMLLRKRERGKTAQRRIRRYEAENTAKIAQALKKQTSSLKKLARKLAATAAELATTRQALAATPAELATTQQALANAK